MKVMHNLGSVMFLFCALFLIVGATGCGFGPFPLDEFEYEDGELDIEYEDDYYDDGPGFFDFFDGGGYYGDDINYRPERWSDIGYQGGYEGSDRELYDFGYRDGYLEGYRDGVRRWNEDRPFGQGTVEFSTLQQPYQAGRQEGFHQGKVDGYFGYEPLY